MRAKERTESMLCWWRRIGVDRVDLAVRRRDGAMLWHPDLPVDELPLAWARAENVRRADVYARPARGYSWPMVFFDDVPVELALRVARKYAALVVETSPQGGSHLWVVSRRPLHEDERATAQRWLAARLEADPASTSGEHLGRLAGFRNWKREGTWVNVRRSSGGLAWDPAPALAAAGPGPRRSRPDAPAPTSDQRGRDISASAREWGWVCGRLEAGADPHDVYHDLVKQAAPRRGRDVTRYACRTMTRALQHVGA